MTCNLLATIVKTAFTELNPSEKNIFKLYASFANPDGTMAYPGIKTLVRISGYSRRKVIYLIKSLRIKGYLLPTMVKKGFSVVYSLNLEKLSTQPWVGAKRAPPSPKESPPQMRRNPSLQPRGGAGCAPYLNTSINNNIYTNTAHARESLPEEVQSGFKEYWKLHPRRLFEGETLKQYIEALKHTTHDEIMRKLRAYRQKIYAEAIPEKYIKSSHGWLKDARWLDDYGKHEREIFRDRAPHALTEASATMANDVSYWEKSWWRSYQEERKAA